MVLTAQWAITKNISFAYNGGIAGNINYKKERKDYEEERLN